MFSGEKTTIDALRDAALAMRSVTTSIGDEIKAIDIAIQSLQAAKCDRLAEMDATKAHEATGRRPSAPGHGGS